MLKWKEIPRLLAGFAGFLILQEALISVIRGRPFSVLGIVLLVAYIGVLAVVTMATIQFIDWIVNHADPDLRSSLRMTLAIPVLASVWVACVWLFMQVP